jgi:plasmid stability protein
MTKNVQIRDVPDDVHSALRRRAADAGMSLSDYLREELTIVAGRTSMHEILTRAARRPGNLPFGEATRDIRAMRDGDRG